MQSVRVLYAYALNDAVEIGEFTVLQALALPDDDDLLIEADWLDCHHTPDQFRSICHS